MSDYRIIVTVKNARILRAMEAAGFQNLQHLSERTGMSTGTLYAVSNLTMSPKKKQGE